METAEQCYIKFKAEDIEFELYADDTEKLLIFLAIEIAKYANKASSVNSMNSEVERAYSIFRAKYPLKISQGSPPAIEEAGLEKEVIRCYLQCMKLDEVISFLDENFRFTTSRSPVSRFYIKLKRAGIRPIKIR